MLQYLADSNSLLNVAVQHQPYKINALLRHNPRHPKIMVHDLVDTVEGVFFVDDSVEQDAEGPDILFFATVGTASEDFGGCVI